MRSTVLVTSIVVTAACGGRTPATPDAATSPADAATSPDATPPDALITHPLVVDTVLDLGLFPLPSATAVGRDGGEAGVLGGKMLWTFGDTFTTTKNSIDNTNILSATAGWSTPADPLALTQPVDASGIPAQLIPYTADEIAANKADPQNGWALWPGRLFDTGGGVGVVVFQRIKRTNGTGFASQGIGTARIAVDETVATRAAADLFAPPEPLFVPASLIDGTAYAFACETVGFLNIACRIARAPAAQVDDRGAYQFYDGAGWQDDPTQAAVVIDHTAFPSISWNPYLGRYLSVAGGVLSSTVRLRTADHPEGPWSEPVEIMAGDTGILAPTDPKKYNYLILEHPELRSADGRSIVISYSRPTTPFHGDVRLARITFH
jgi:hypothetical protein